MHTRSETPTLPFWVFLAFPAVAMSLGWAYRGFIGGGPLGAMIPGAMVALALCWLLGYRQLDNLGLIAAFGAVGIGFGGEMTYGQTVGLASDLNTMGWGILGLTVKGAIWGFSGGAVLALAFTIGRYRPGRVIAGLCLMAFGTWLGWYTVNAPKLIYFSNRLDRPREEMWMGLFVGTLFLLLACATSPFNRVMWRFASYAFAGGGLGFGLGGVLLSLGRNSSLDQSLWPWWKGMEYTFGLLFGLALAYAAWQERDTLREAAATMAPRPTVSLPGVGVLTILVFLAAVTANLNFGYLSLTRFDYSLIGVVLLAVALVHETLAWHIAITMTSLAFLFDLGEAAANDWLLFPLDAALPLGLLIVIPIWWLVEQVRQSGAQAAPFGFHLICWTAYLVTTEKTMGQLYFRSHVPVEYLLFAVFGVATYWLSTRVRRSNVLA